MLLGQNSFIFADGKLPAIFIFLRQTERDALIGRTKIYRLCGIAHAQYIRSGPNQGRT